MVRLLSQSAFSGVLRGSLMALALFLAGGAPAAYTREMMEEVARYVDARDHGAAAAVMLPYLDAHPDDFSAWYDWGQMLTDLRRPAEAGAALKHAATLVDDPRVLLAAISAQEKAGLLDGALSGADELLQQARAVLGRSEIRRGF